jgi:hypothetical protein
LRALVILAKQLRLIATDDPQSGLPMAAFCQVAATKPRPTCGHAGVTPAGGTISTGERLVGVGWSLAWLRSFFE